MITLLESGAYSISVSLRLLLLLLFTRLVDAAERAVHGALIQMMLLQQRAQILDLGVTTLQLRPDQNSDVTMKSKNKTN